MLSRAGATKVELLWKSSTSSDGDHVSINILDNGSGMDTLVLRLAPQFGNGTHSRRKRLRGMGRFGIKDCHALSISQLPARSLYGHEQRE